jgi:predicted nucleic acid-binding protein
VITAIDTNILLDILIPDEEFMQSSKSLLDNYAEKGQLIICEVVYAELASQFHSEKTLKDFFADTHIRLMYSNETSLFLAADRWKAYTINRKDSLRCTKCGQSIPVICPSCKNTILFRQHIISDFIIGAHAFIYADLLLTRDRGFYKTYFKDLKIG